MTKFLVAAIMVLGLFLGMSLGWAVHLTVELKQKDMLLLNACRQMDELMVKHEGWRWMESHGDRFAVPPIPPPHPRTVVKAQ